MGGESGSTGTPAEMSEDETSDGSQADTRPLILFDGVCNLCNSAVQWVIDRDGEGRYAFASLQSEVAQRRLREVLTPEQIEALPDAIILLDDVGVHTESTAALRISRGLGFPSRALGAGLIIPRMFRDVVYRWIARSRYRWFGRKNTCMVPASHLTHRFLDAGESRPIIPPAVGRSAPQ